MELSEFVEELKSRIDIVDIVSEYVELKRTGKQYKALCPFHPEKTPSFFVNPERQFFHCFGCGVGGDVISFVMKQEDLEFMDALEVLAKKAGISINSLRPSTSAKGLRQKLLELNNLAMHFFRDALSSNTEALSYLKARAITDKAREIFFLGYAPAGGDKLIQYLKNKGIEEELIIKAGLAKIGSDTRAIDLFRHRIMFPIYNSKAEVVGFGGRVLSDEQLGPKYLNSPETLLFKKSQEIFGLYQARQSIKEKGYVIITEGYFDVIGAYQSGFKNVVAPLGTALTDSQARLLKRYTDKVLLIFDSDTAGVQASKRAALTLLVEAFQVKVLLLPKGEDLDSFIRKNTAEALRKLFARALPVVDFFLAMKGDRVAHIRTLTETISRINDPIFRGMLLQELSEKSKIPFQILLEETDRRKNLNKQKVDTLKEICPPTAEELLLALFISYPDLRKRIRTNITEEMFSDPELKSIYVKVSTNQDSPIHEILSDEEFKRISSIIVRTQIDENALERNLSDSIRRIKQESIKRRIDELQKAIAAAEKTNHEKVIEYQRTLQSLMREAKNEGLF